MQGYNLDGSNLFLGDSLPSPPHTTDKSRDEWNNDDDWCANGDDGDDGDDEHDSDSWFAADGDGSESDRDKNWELIEIERTAYFQKVKEFLESSKNSGIGDVSHKVTRPEIDVVEPADYPGFVTDCVRVDGLPGSVTADNLYDAFGRFGRVIWARVAPSEVVGRRHPNSYMAIVRFEQPSSVDRATTENSQFGFSIRCPRVSIRKHRGPAQ